MGAMAAIVWQAGKSPTSYVRGPATVDVSVPATPAALRLHTLPFPAVGEAAVSIPSYGVEYSSKVQTSVPIASLTKMMTALVFLRDYPISLTQSGPDVTITGAEVSNYKAEIKTDQSSIPIVKGEVLNERQLLDGLLVHSANDFATVIALFDAGSVSGMVAKMNATAASMGLTQTHFYDVSGYNPRSVSSADDLLKLATRDMTIPVFATIVRQTSVVEPVAGVESTYTPLLGQQGVVGVKTGYTSQAGGCDVMANDVAVGGRTVQILAVTLGQQGSSVLYKAAEADLALVNAAAAGLAPWNVTTAGGTVGDVGWGSHLAAAVSTRTVTVPVLQGKLPFSRITNEVLGGLEVKAGQRIATVSVTSGPITETSPIVAAADVIRPYLR
jgi:D-alanyl-D-alanine carboxypeptidase (penicillin-binding protein 5/6)